MKNLSCFFLFLFYGAAGAASPETLSLAKGESLTLNLDFTAGDVAVTEAAILGFLVSEDRRSILLHAKETGEVTLSVWEEGGGEPRPYAVRVYGTRLKKIVEEFQENWGGVEGLAARVLENRIHLIGEAPSLEDFKEIEAFAERYPQIRNEAQLSPEVLGLLQTKIREAIGIPGIRTRAIRNTIVLEGQAYSTHAAEKALAIARLFTPDVVNLIDVRESGRVVGREKMIRVDLFFMEIQKSALKTFGIQWAPGSFPAGTAANMSVGGASPGGEGSLAGFGKNMIGFVLNLLPKIRLIRESGLGRVLENPTLYVKNGDRGVFFSGTEVPYLSEEQVSFKEVGIRMEVEPILSGADVDLKLAATIASPSANIEGGINRSTVETTAYVPHGEAVVLGGIVGNKEVRTGNRVPKNIDTSTALWTLFASRDFQQSRTELVIFALPRIAEEGKRGTGAMGDWETFRENMMREESLKEYEALTRGKKKKKRGKR